MKINDKYVKKHELDFLSEQLLDNNILKDIEYFNAKSNVTIDNRNQNVNWDTSMYKWLQNNEWKTDYPDLPLKRIYINTNKKKNRNNFYSGKTFNKKLSLDDNIFFNIISNVFFSNSNDKHRSYPSAGALFPVIPILIVLNNNAIKNVKTPGAYIINTEKKSLDLISNWKKINNQYINLAMSPVDNNLKSNVAMAYSIDLRKSVIKYKYMGYKHSIIEIGSIIESLRYQLMLNSNYRERVCSSFNSNLLADLCKINKIFSPIMEIQWIGSEY